MKNPHRRAVAIPSSSSSVGRRSHHRHAVHLSNPSTWKEIRGGDAPLYTLYELNEGEPPVNDDDHVEYVHGDEEDDEYEYYEVDHDESAEGKRDVDNNRRSMSVSKRRNTVLPSVSVRAISSKLSTLHQRLGIDSNNNVPFLSLQPVTKFMSLSPRLESSSSIAAAAAIAVMGTTAALSIWILRTFILHKSSRKLDILHNKRKTVGGGGVKNDKRKHNDKKNKKKYGDYSTGYPMESNDEVVDLDETSGKKAEERNSYWNALKMTAWIPFHSVVHWMEGAKLHLASMAKTSAWASSMGNALLLFSKTRKQLGPVTTETDSIAEDNAKFMSMTENEDEYPYSASNRASTEKEEEEHATRTLRQQLDTLAEAHESLEQEYEASLRMLHEARMELRQLKSKRSNNNNDDDDRDNTENRQQQILEDTIQKLEQKYKQQMKEQMERYRNQTEQKLRAELTQEYQAALQSQSEQMAQELQQQKNEFLSSPSFQQLVDEASSLQIQKAVAQAVQDTIREQQAQAREEMMRVRDGIQKVLDRERRMMKEQVAKATSQVREWVKRRQVEQWQRREEQLVVEARELGLLEEEEEEEVIGSNEEKEEEEMVGVGFSSRRDRDGEYSAGSSFRDERRRWEVRDGSVPREEEEEETIRGDDYPDQSSEYHYEEKNDNGEDDGTVGDMGQEFSDPRAQPSSRRGQPRYSSSSPRNVYREAARRKQRRREEGL